MGLQPFEEMVIEEKKNQLLKVSYENPTYRTAHFLKPSISTQEQTQNLINPPPNHHPTKPVSPILKILTSKVHFNGWNMPLKSWEYWVEKMRILHEPIWRKANIFEAIMGSTLNIPKCFGSIFSFVEKWCPENSSFVLPWGEVSLTLEDVMVLGGFSVTGESVLKEIRSKELLEIEESLHVARLEMFRRKLHRATQQQWLQMWMDKGSEIEHEAFLSLWLSRYVLAADDAGTINKSVFRIAVLLARGTKIALAPAVLASIYRDLRLLKEKIGTLRGITGKNSCDHVSVLKLWSPLQLLQAWIWERFQTISPKSKPVSDGFPRLARWNKVKVLRIDDAGFETEYAIKSFKWRPYVEPLNNRQLSVELYPKKAIWVSHSAQANLVLESYVRMIRISELVGLDCVEQYRPHRVSMQFGFDQDIPIADHIHPHCCIDSACRNYFRPMTCNKLYVPSRFCEPGVTMNYLEWWKNSTKVKKETETCGIELGCAKPAANSIQESLGLSLAERQRVKVENNDANVPPGFDPKGNRLASESGNSENSHSVQKSRALLPCSSLGKTWSRKCDSGVGKRLRSSIVDVFSEPSGRVEEMQAVDDCSDHQTMAETEVLGSNYIVKTVGKWNLRKRKNSYMKPYCTVCRNS